VHILPRMHCLCVALYQGVRLRTSNVINDLKGETLAILCVRERG
jgi:hypothetical protein